MECRYLDLAARERLEALYNEGRTMPAIAAELGVHISTIYREIKRGSTGKLDINGRYDYSAAAQVAVVQSIARRGRRKRQATA